MQKLDKEILQNISEKYGDAFYLLDTEQFRRNYQEMKEAFQAVYPRFNIAYSYKTNYMPKLCRVVNELGGYAEVVSDMETEIARRCGVEAERIIWNGPVKKADKLEELLTAGGSVNIDNLTEAECVRKIAAKHKDKRINVGIRCNFDVGDGTLSRFGFDVDGQDFDAVCRMIAETPNISFTSLQCHFAKRKAEYWPARAEGMLDTYEKVKRKYHIAPKRIDLGGGIYGKMPESLCKELGYTPPDYAAYAQAGAAVFMERLDSCRQTKEQQMPELIIEPGSALVGDCMKFIARIDHIKNIRGKTIAAVTGSQKNISMQGINPPIEIIDGGGHRQMHTDVDIAGYTCIESDFLYTHYNGLLGEGDFVIVSNCGSYSIVMKPPFIQPNVPVLDISGGADRAEVVKREETFDDLFGTFAF